MAASLSVADASEFKTCNGCRKQKHLSAFGRRRSIRDGLSTVCKECLRDKDHENYLKNPGKHKERSRKYRADHPGQSSKQAASWREKYPEREAAQQAVKKALRHGTLKRLPCERCSESWRATVAHHGSYAKEHWLHVEWLCGPCHRYHHRFDKDELSRQEWEESVRPVHVIPFTDFTKATQQVFPYMKTCRWTPDARRYKTRQKRSYR